MRWRLVLGLSGLGLLVGLLSLFGLWPVWAEFLVWTAVGVVWVAVLHYRIRDRFFWHGAATAGIGGMLGILMQVLFTPTYLQNNPQVGAGFGDASIGEARLILLATGVAVSAVFALITGGALWFTFPRHLRRSKNGED